MAKKIQGTVIVLILCLCGYLVYQMYGEDVIYLIKNKMETEKAAETEPHEESSETAQEKKEKLPGYFHAGKAGRAPVVKNQGEFGTCWAVASSSALESALLPGKHQIFSADHIAAKNAYGKDVEEGGAYIMSMSYLAGWLGPVTEEEDPYGDGYSPDGLSPVCHVQEMQLLREKDITSVKELVFQCGVIQSSFYMDMENSGHSSVYYNEFEHAYCYDGDKEANHDVLIIGWDDAYPRERFSVDVKKDGAFICQNSWGREFGEDGVFYVSYEDVLIGSSCVGYTRVEETNNYHHIYQTDLCGWIGQIGYDSPDCYFANVYTAGQAEELAAVGFYATGKDTEYTVYVVKGFVNSLSFILKNSVASGSFQNPGYYTVDFDEPESLEEGERFAVAVKIHTPGSVYPVATEFEADENSRNVTIEDGEGYLSINGIIWQNTEESNACNICLKAYTRNMD